MMDPVASEFRRMRRHVERVNRRIALADLPGKVIPGSQDQATRTLRLDLGRSADGRVVKGPPTKWQQPGAGTLKIHATPADNEQMRLRSPSGTVGTASLADWSTYDDDNAPPSRSGEETVLEHGGKSRITLREDGMVLSIGATSIVLTEAGIAAIGATSTFDGDLAVTGETLTHNELNIGSTHKHGGVERGGAKTDPPAEE